jgi:hypothetical protein
MGPVDIHIQRLMDRVPQATATQLTGASWVVRVPGVKLPPGWSKPETAVHLVVPEGYPYSRPDCFWADEDLRLATNALPQNSALSNPIPGLQVPSPLLWFSWHLENWNASRDDLITWLKVINRRFVSAV